MFARSEAEICTKHGHFHNKNFKKYKHDFNRSTLEFVLYIERKCSLLIRKNVVFLIRENFFISLLRGHRVQTI